MKKILTLLLGVALLLVTLPLAVMRSEIIGTATAEACVHVYEDVVASPTCTKQGYTTYTCPVCGDSYVDDYVDATGHNYSGNACTRCGKAVKTLTLRYDDHYDVIGKAVEIIDAGIPTSYKVGYGVEENKVLDTAVVTIDGDALIATGIGTARVRIDGTLYEITVESAPISLILLAGQSNMRGSEGNADQSIVCPDGMVYATYGDDRGADNVAMTVENATMFAASALTGEYSNINVNGTTDCLSGYPIYSLTEAGVGKIGPDSGFAYEWVRQTGEKVWIVNAAHGGTSITTWQDSGENYKEAAALFSACQETLRQEIAAGHYTLSHMGYFWCQGCNDYNRSAEWYVEKYLTMHENFKSALAFDHDSNASTEDKVFEFAGIIPVRAGNESYTSYRQGTYADSTTAKYYESFKDLRFNGPRVAQYWMGNNPELEDIWLVCNVGEDWVTMPDGTDGVAAYFNAHYENGTVDYPTQVAQKASWYTPTTPAAVHDSIHYNQIGYNEVGRESVRNALIMLGEIETPKAETTVKFLTWDGYTPTDKVTASTSGNSGTLVVPVVYPLWQSKKVTYNLSDGLIWNYYDLLAVDAQTTGTLTSGDKTVTLVKAEPGTHFANHLSQLPENLCCGVNLWDALEHDEYYYANGTGWGVHSSGTVYSVTIPVNAGDKIFATSFGKAGANGGSSNGIRVTFFDAYGVAKTLAPTDTYAEFTANGGYLIAPKSAVAVNIPMWTNSDDNELYLLTAEHNYEPAVTSPTCTEQGYTTYTCPDCGDSYVDNYVDALRHSYDTSKWGYKEADGHARLCSVCNERDAVVEHTSSGATTEDTAETCIVCGYVITPEFGHTHSASDEWKYNDTHHWHDCVANDGPEYNKEAHSFGNWVKVDNNTHKRTCTCGKVETANHTWNDGEITTQPTHTEYGEMTYTCADCGATKAEQIDKTTAHSFGEWEKVDESTHERTCACGKVEFANHTWNDGEITTQPTHTEYGERTYTCLCGATKAEQVDKTTAHSFSDWIKVDDSTHKHVCECGEEETENHSFGEWVVTKEATETETGSKTKTCACGHTVTEEIPALGNGTEVPDDPNNGSTEDHSKCEASGWKRFWNAIGNFFRRLFGLPEKCVCGKEL